MPATNESYAQAAIKRIAAALARQGGLGGMLTQLAASTGQNLKGAIGLTPEREQLDAEAQSVMPQLSGPARMELAKQNVMGFGTGDLGGAPGVLRGAKGGGWSVEKALKAKEMWNAGKSEKEIWKELRLGVDPHTGTVIGEIPGTEAKLTPQGREMVEYAARTGQPTDFAPAKHIVEYPELYHTYPEAGDINTRISANPKGSSGTWNIDAPTRIARESLDKLVSLDLTTTPGAYTALGHSALPPEMVALNQFEHEISHPIQAREGLQMGGSPQHFYPSAKYPLLQAAYDEALRTGRFKVGDADERNLRLILERAMLTENKTPEQAYFGLPGEAMARGSQRRLYYPEETLVERPPAMNYGIAPRDWTPLQGWPWPLPGWPPKP